jgi:transposase
MFVYLQKQQQLTLTKQLPDMNLTKIQKNKLVAICEEILKDKKLTFRSKYSLYSIIVCIIHKLKTGCQWRCLFIDNDVVKRPFSWQLVYYYFTLWQKNGILELLMEKVRSLFCSKATIKALYVDGTHTPCKRKGDKTGYQGRKKAMTTNMLVLCQENGLPLACSDPIAGNHNDLYQVDYHITTMIRSLKKGGIMIAKGTFINADKGFDCIKLRKKIFRMNLIPNIMENKRNRRAPKRGTKRFFDDKHYQLRYVNERLFAWIDSFRTLAIRHEKKSVNHLAFWHIACAIVLLTNL